MSEMDSPDTISNTELQQRTNQVSVTEEWRWTGRNPKYKKHDDFTGQALSWRGVGQERPGRKTFKGDTKRLEKHIKVLKVLKRGDE
jgi:hypothetical protein